MSNESRFLLNKDTTTEYSESELSRIDSPAYFAKKQVINSEIKESTYAKKEQLILLSQNQYFTSVLLVMSGIVLTTGSLWLFFRAWRLILKEKTDGTTLYNSHTNVFKSLPCHNCVYFSDNLYLKCAINPGTVMTSEAYSCRDHCPPPSISNTKKWNLFRWK
jgi:hypothetical protein